MEWTILTLTLIRKEEDFLWGSAKDLLECAIKQASFRLRGVYTFDLLTFDFQHETKTFNYNELSEILVNSSQRIKPGEQILIRYSTCFGLLQKMVDEPWGKVAFRSAVEVFRDKPGLLYTLVKRMLKPAEFTHGPVIALLNDLSASPLYYPHDENQNIFLQKLIREQSQNAIEFPPEVFVQDINGLKEIIAGTAN
ncbi:MAG: hypothetical protein HGA80_05415 [Candidatus Omnitrophica bacterium]|nr:hypothetical protein [Candidatus Omnitrophota bacterium]